MRRRIHEAALDVAADVLCGLGLLLVGGAWLCFRAAGDPRAGGVRGAAERARGWDPEAERLFDEW